MTPGQCWRRKRDLALASAALQGASLRFLGDVFDLDPARVSTILRSLREEFGPCGGLTVANVADAIRVRRHGRARSTLGVGLQSVAARDGPKKSARRAANCRAES